MAIEFYNRNWRVPSSWNGTEDNNNKVSNYSMNFDGSSEYIDLGNTEAVKLGAGDFTFSAWINPISWGSVYEGIYVNAAINGVFIGKDNAGNFVLRIYGVSNIITYSTLPTVNTWTHICITRNNGLCSLFYNASSVATATSTHDFNATANVFIGSDNSGADFNGNIDQLAIFDYSLSQAQVTELYGSSSTGVGNPMAITNGRKPIAYYPLGDYSAYNGTEYLVANSALSDYVFDFNSDVIEVSNSSDLRITGNMTLSAWINSNNISSNQTLISKNGAGGRNYLFWLLGGKIRLNTQSQGVTANTALQSNRWYHVAVSVIDGIGTFYVDGVADGTGSFTVTPPATNQPFYIGRGYSPAAYYYFDGKISNAAIFNTALPATGTESVASLYNYGTPPDISSYSGLQGFWKLDAGSTFDGSNFTVPDESSNSNDGTSSGMTAANLVQSNLNILSPYSRYALDFDGANDYIDFGSGFTTTDQYTISAWINADDLTSSGYGYLLGNSSGTGFSLDEGGGAAGAGKFYLWTGSGTLDVISSTALIINNWFNVVFVCDKTVGTKGEIKFYLNGSIDKITTLSNQDLNSITLLSYIGYSPSHFLNSQLSNVSIWNAALTAAQVSEIYNEGKPSNLNNHSAYSNLVSWWQLGENSSFNSNWTVIDEKGTNNGTSANMAEDDLVNGVGTTANGLSSGMGGADNINGDAPYSTSNALSYGMGVDAKSTSVPT